MSEGHRFVRACPDVVPVHQPMQLFAGKFDHVLLKQARPRKLLSALDHLRPKTEVVFIKPLFRMWLIDRENAVSNPLSWGGQTARAPRTVGPLHFEATLC